MGRGRKLAQGIRSNWVGEELVVVLLLLLEFVVELSTGIQVREFATPVVTRGSILFDRDCTASFFLGRSATVDFERGRPIFGRSPPTLVDCCLSRSPLMSNGMGDGEWLAKLLLELCRMLRKDLRKALELLRLQFHVGSSAAMCGLRTIELCDTAGVRNDVPISSF